MVYRILLIGMITCCGLRQTLAESVPSVSAHLESPGDLIELPLAGREEMLHYWLRLPVGYAPGQRPALLIGLHGTDDTARQMLDFVALLPTPVPLMIVAPQSLGRGWSSADILAIKAMLVDLANRFTYDEQRVLLLGFSAGAAMSLQLVFGEQVAVTAVAALAGYVPPRLTTEAIHHRREVPVFFAVGMQDGNHEPMREGVARLRNAGSDVYLYRPRIGHVLDTEVAEAALRWFFGRCATVLQSAVFAVAVDADPSQSAPMLEAVITQACWHEPAHLEAAQRLLSQIEASGQDRLNQADRLVRLGQEVDAVDLLRKIETDYGPSRMGARARDRRWALEQSPAVHGRLVVRNQRRYAERAFRLYLEARELMQQRQYALAADCCRQLLGGFEDTPWADSARDMLEYLNERNSVE